MKIVLRLEKLAREMRFKVGGDALLVQVRLPTRTPGMNQNRYGAANCPSVSQGLDLEKRLSRIP